MQNNKTYKPIIKNFMGMDVRTIEVGRHEYVVCKDMFNALGLVRDNGDWSDAKQKMLDFLEIIKQKEYSETFRVLLKQGKTKVYKEVECLNIEVVPVVLTQFKPTVRRGQDALNRWSEFMQFVNMLLQYHECHKYIITDKDKQKQSMDEIVELGGQPVITNQQVNRIMGELILKEEPKFAIKKEELKIYQPQTTIDLLEVRDFVLERFKNAFEFYKKYDIAYNLALKASLNKYHIELNGSKEDN